MRFIDKRMDSPTVLLVRGNADMRKLSSSVLPMATRLPDQDELAVWQILAASAQAKGRALSTPEVTAQYWVPKV